MRAPTALMAMMALLGCATAAAVPIPTGTPELDGTLKAVAEESQAITETVVVTLSEQLINRRQASTDMSSVTPIAYPSGTESWKTAFPKASFIPYEIQCQDSIPERTAEVEEKCHAYFVCDPYRNFLPRDESILTDSDAWSFVEYCANSCFCAGPDDGAAAMFKRVAQGGSVDGVGIPRPTGAPASAPTALMDRGEDNEVMKSIPRPSPIIPTVLARQDAETATSVDGLLRSPDIWEDVILTSTIIMDVRKGAPTGIPNQRIAENRFAVLSLKPMKDTAFETIEDVRAPMPTTMASTSDSTASSVYSEASSSQNTDEPAMIFPLGHRPPYIPTPDPSRVQVTTNGTRPKLLPAFTTFTAGQIPEGSQAPVYPGIPGIPGIENPPARGPPGANLGEH